jgi:hypothetical protein
MKKRQVESCRCHLNLLSSGFSENPKPTTNRAEAITCASTLAGTNTHQSITLRPKGIKVILLIST